MATVGAAHAQRTTVVVRDQSGSPVAFALVAPVGTTAMTADSLGRAAVGLRGRDSVFVRVRRIGFAPLDQYVPLPAPDTIELVVRRIVPRLDTVEVVGTYESPLARRGFYDRLARSQRGATVGHFITPEQLELQLPMTLTQSLRDSPYIRVGAGRNGRPVLLGRGACPLNIVVDGMLVQGTEQDAVTETFPTSINRSGTYRPRPLGGGASGGSYLDINSLVGGNEIAAIEIYPSTANAPYELQAAASSGRGTCGIVGIWTGGRR